jgi:hypothetical protein
MNPIRSRRRSLKRSLGAVTGASLVALWAGAGCGVDNAIVGGSCASGYSPCGDTCCLGEPEAGRLDASTDTSKDGARDGRETDGKSGDREIQDSRTEDRRAEGAITDSCTPPYDTVEHCGACDIACNSMDTCSLGDSGTYQCVPLCSLPLEDCNGTCVDESNDPDNCGACGKICRSGFCAGGLCQGTTPGDIVVIGYDYHVSNPEVAQANLLANAAFIPTSNPLRILSFELYADATSVSNVKEILNAQAAALGRQKNMYTVPASGADVPAELSIVSYDEFIVYDQADASPGVLGPLGSTWAATLAAFTSAGGVVLSLDGAAGTTQEMPVFNTNAGLLAISNHTVLPKNTPLVVTAPGAANVVGSKVVSPFASELDSVYFTTSVPTGGNVTYVVVDPTSDAGQAPVVVHVEVP